LPGEGNPAQRPATTPPVVDGEGSLAPGPAPEPGNEPVPFDPPAGGAAPDLPAPIPTNDGGPIGVIASVLTGVVGQVGLALSADAAVAVAAEFTFPLALALAVLLFLIVQDQVDRRDPKLRTAPAHAAETLIGFKPEHEL
jgi:hypothetical protein